MTAPGISDSEICNERAKTICRCGNEKDRGRTFCKNCYFRLPDNLRERLYQRKGYVMTYREATAELDKAV